MATSTGTGRCKKCGNEMFAVGDSFNSSMTVKCLTCESNNRPASKVKTTVEDPGHEVLMQALNLPSGPVSKVTKPTLSPMPVLGGTVQSALSIMKNLSMPKDIKEFKLINKIITDMEKLIGGTPNA